jgi:2,4-diketo-3-deoxy-L-fuconate hydrolase
MKLLRYGNPGSERPGMRDTDGSIRDLSALVDDLSGQTLSDHLLEVLHDVNPSSLPLVDPTVRIACPVSGSGAFIGVGLNYRDHAREINLPPPREPILFLKSLHAISGPCDPVMLPRESVKTDWEVELGVVIGKKARCIRPEESLGHIFGYCVINDITERAFQLEREGTWTKGKGCDTFGPVGPWLVTRDEIPDPQHLELWLKVNDELMQSGSTADMIFGVAELVSYISMFGTLHPGDIIATGTPAGVGMSRKPQPVYLKAGDVMTLGVSGLGEQRQTVVPWQFTPEGQTAG